MKAFLVFFLVINFAVSPRLEAAGNENISEIKKDLRTFTRILRAVLDDEDQRGLFPDEFAGPDSFKTLYLADQGVVLTLNMSADGPFRRIGVAGLSSELAFPGSEWLESRPRWNGLFKEHDGFFDGERVFHDSEQQQAVRDLIDRLSQDSSEIRELSSSAIEEANRYSGVMSQDPEYIAKMNKLRQKATQLRQFNQEMFRQISVEIGGKKTLNDDELNKYETEFLNQRNELKDSVRIGLEEIRNLQDQFSDKWNSQLKDFEIRLVEALCEYGASMRSLPDDERVTVIMRNAALVNGKRENMVYIFRKSDLIACRNGQISKEDLRQKATSYSY